jgi:galactoside O-acetyltransferase
MVRRMRSLLEDTTPLTDRWRELLEGNLEVGNGTIFEGSRLDIREKGCQISVGSDCRIHCDVILERAGAHLEIGSRTLIGGRTIINTASHVKIGDNVLISYHVLITDSDSHSLDFEERKLDCLPQRNDRKADWRGVAMAPVVIRDKSWVGAKSIILKGVCIGEGAIVGAGSVVTRNVPDWTLVVGNPARAIRELPH